MWVSLIKDLTSDVILFINQNSISHSCKSLPCVYKNITFFKLASFIRFLHFFKEGEFQINNKPFVFK